MRSRRFCACLFASLLVWNTTHRRVRADEETMTEAQAFIRSYEETVKPLNGIEDSMLDRMGALGMISVFDVEEVGADVLVAETNVQPLQSRHRANDRNRIRGRGTVPEPTFFRCPF